MDFVCIAARAFLLSSFFLATTASAQTSTPSRPPVEAFGNLPEASRPQLSPDGTKFVTLQSFNGRRAALVYQTEAPPGTMPTVIPSDDWYIVGASWARNDRLILIVKKNYAQKHDTEIHTWVRTIAIDADGKNPAILMRNVPTFQNNTSSADFIDLNIDGGDDALVQFYALETPSLPSASIITDNTYKFRLDLYSVNLKTGQAKVLMHGTPESALQRGDGTKTWISDGHGQVVARIDGTTRPLKEHVFVRDGESWKEIGAYDATGDNSAGFVGLTADGTALAQFDFDQRTMQHLRRYDIKTGQFSPLFAAPRNDVTSILRDDWDWRVIGAYYEDDKTEVKYFDPALDAVQRGLEKAFPGLSVLPVSWNRAKDRVIVAVEGPRSPPAYYYLNRTTHQAAIIAQGYPKLSPNDLGEMKPYSFKARDGLDIPAYITLPPGKPAKNLPAIVMPHGGPDSRDSMEFDWWAQFLANRGYVVLQPNFRGSSGYGHKFTEAGLQRWGLEMQDDITDGVKKMIADGIADPKRVCIVGASYGGYAALAGATFTPDVYACAVAFAPVSDLETMLGTESHNAGKESQVLSFWGSRIGNVITDIDRLLRTSPDRHADAVKCPILLIHAESDTTVPIGQSELEERALKKAGKKVTFVRIPGGEDHYLNTAETRIRVLQESERFLKENIGN